jgi:DNA transposition AAA+ family ATPase
MTTETYTSYRALIENTIVPHAQFKEAMSALDELYFESLTLSKPYGTGIVGGPGTGKTIAIEQFVSKYPQYELSDQTIIPVLHFSLPANATAKNIIQAALHAMNNRFEKGTDGSLYYQLVHLLSKCQVKTIVIDEAQHLVMHGKSPTLQKAAATLKRIMDGAKVNMVLIGTPLLENLLYGSDELSRRFSTSITMNEWEPDNSDDINEVAGVLKKFLSTPGLDLVFEDLITPEFALRLIYGCGGRISYMSKLVAGVVKLAKEDARKAVTRSDFEKVFVKSIWSKAKPRTNPFSKSFVMRKLNGPTEPFWVEL